MTADIVASGRLRLLIAVFALYGLCFLTTLLRPLKKIYFCILFLSDAPVLKRSGFISVS